MAPTPSSSVASAKQQGQQKQRVRLLSSLSERTPTTADGSRTIKTNSPRPLLTILPLSPSSPLLLLLLLSSFPLLPSPAHSLQLPSLADSDELLRLEEDLLSARSLQQQTGPNWHFAKRGGPPATVSSGATVDGHHQHNHNQHNHHHNQHHNQHQGRCHPAKLTASPAVRDALAHMLLAAATMEEGGMAPVQQREVQLPPALASVSRPAFDRFARQNEGQESTAGHRFPQNGLGCPRHDDRPVASRGAKRRARGAQLTGGAKTETPPGMPLELRSLCQFAHVDNVDERRVPRLLPEVRCLCDRPKRAPMAGIRCEPLDYDVPVLVFDEKCQQFRQSRQRVTLGCVAVFPSASRTQFSSRTSLGQQPDTRPLNL